MTFSIILRWCKYGEAELIRELNTMERDDLIDLVMSYMSLEGKKDFVKAWKTGS